MAMCCFPWAPTWRWGAQTILPAILTCRCANAVYGWMASRSWKKAKWSTLRCASSATPDHDGPMSAMGPLRGRPLGRVPAVKQRCVSAQPARQVRRGGQQTGGHGGNQVVRESGGRPRQCQRAAQALLRPEHRRRYGGDIGFALADGNDVRLRGRLRPGCQPRVKHREYAARRTLVERHQIACADMVANRAW